MEMQETVVMHDAPIASPEVGLHNDWLNSLIAKTVPEYPWAVEIVAGGVSAFVIAFFLKNFWRIIAMSLALLLCVLVILHATEYMPFPVEYIKSLFGITDSISIQDIVASKMTWMRAHPIATVSIIIGALLGWKVG